MHIRAVLLLASLSMGTGKRLMPISRLNLSDPAPENSTCKSIEDLASTFASSQDMATALDTWGCPPRTPCHVCLSDCADAVSFGPDDGIFMRWWEDKSRLQMYLGNKGSASAGDQCAEISYFSYAEQYHSELKSLGGLGKVPTGVCTKMSMRTVAYLHISIARALGVDIVKAMDAAHFARMPCNWMPKSIFGLQRVHPTLKRRFSASVLKLATKGITLYQGYYGAAFAQGSAVCLSPNVPQAVQALCPKLMAKCQDEYDNFRQLSLSKNLDKVAEEVLAFTATLKGKSVSDLTQEDAQACLPAMEKYKLLMKHVNKELSKCLWSYFYVVVSKSPSCTGNSPAAKATINHKKEAERTEADEIPEDIPGEIPDEIPDEIPNDFPDAFPDEIPNAIPDKIPDENPEEIPEDNDEIPDEIPKGASKGGSDDKKESSCRPLQASILCALSLLWLLN